MMLGVGAAGPRGPLGASGRSERSELGRSATGDPPVARDDSASSASCGDPPPATRRPGVPRPSEREAWAILASADRVGPVTFGLLIARYGTARAVLQAARRPRRRGGGPGERDAGGRLADPLEDPRLAAAIRAADDGSAGLLAAIRHAGVGILTAADEDYPGRLRAIELPPPVLYVAGSRGALDRDRAIAVVGTRRPSDVGRRDTTRIAGSIARTGAAVISGLAVGIDGEAHVAALDESGTTVAVLGSGHLRLSPARHRLLAQRIVTADGAIVSELPPLTVGDRHTFPRRNRIISGLADAVVVAEAGAGSGALITAAWALEQGRECFLVPGSIDAPASAGCLRFLRDHHGLARIVVGVPELVAELQLDDDRTGPGATADLGPVERAIAQRLVDRPATLDELVAATGEPPATILAAVSRLEVRGLAVDVFGRYRSAGHLATRGADGHRSGGRTDAP